MTEECYNGSTQSFPLTSLGLFLHVNFQCTLNHLHDQNLQTLEDIMGWGKKMELQLFHRLHLFIWNEIIQ